MSALRRLKAYFGMVPAEEFDADDFDQYHADYGSGHPEPGLDRAGFDRAAANSPREGDYAAERAGTRRPPWSACDSAEDSFGSQAGHPVPPRVHHSRPPSWVAESRAAESRPMEPRAGESWATETSMSGSLAIDTAAIGARPMIRQPVVPQRVAPVPRAGGLAEDPYPLARIVTLHPHNYNEARPIGERYREGNPVIINLTEMEDRDAKRLVDFAAGLAFALRGSIDKVTHKVFLLSPPNVDVSAEDRRRIAEGCFFN
ncbi:MAG: cell division protein SepF [Pseudonocardiaceae bacterium]